MATQSPSAILRKLKKPHDTDKDDPRQKTTTDKQGDDKNDEKMPVKGGKRNALIDFIAKNKKHAA
jgi:hypothetical protein